MDRQFAGTPDSARAARAFVVEELADAGVDLEEAALLVSELASNAFRHARSSFEVHLLRFDHRVRIEVIDDEPELLATMRSPDDGGGRGLQIVDAVAAAWGTYATAETKVVWCDLRRSA